MSPFQWLYDKIRNIKTPAWLKVLLADIQTIIWQILLQVGQNYITQIEAKIVEVSKMGLNSKEKFRVVYNYAKSLMPDAKEHTINLLIETLYARIKLQF